MEEKNLHFRHLMLYYFRKGKNSSQAKRKICSVNGDKAVADSTVYKGFARFKSGNFDLENRECSGRHALVDDDAIELLIEFDPHSTTRYIAEKLKISHTGVGRHLEGLEYINRYDVWIPNHLTGKKLLYRVSTSNSLLVRNGNDPFLKRIITGDEKWIVFNNPKCKRSWQKEKCLQIPL